MKTKVILGQLGSPESPKVSHVRKYLKEFLADPRVVDLNPLFWKIILYCFVLPFRPKQSAKAYRRIWNGTSFPLIDNTKSFAAEVRKSLPAEIELDYCFLLSRPTAKDLFAKWNLESPETRAEKVLILPQFPQYTESTIASAFDKLAMDLEEQVNLPHVELITSYHRLRPFITHSCRLIKESIQHKKIDHLVISFHGIPLRRITQKKDLYFRHCAETFYLIKKELNLDLPISACFQSRFGSEQWLGPATDDFCKKLVEKGQKNIAVYCPSFVVDCLETTDEIGHELKHEINHVGGELVHVPCLNSDPAWARDYAEFISDIVNNGFNQAQNKWFNKVDSKEAEKMMPEQIETNAPLTKEQKSILKVVFLTLFVDLMGFSIIFPLFPSLAKYYQEVDGNSTILTSLYSGIDWLLSWAPTSANVNPTVLFGGIIGAVFSLAQFFMAPVWGSISDRIGRRPVMYLSVIGTMASYLLWAVSGSFGLFILSRFLGGMMGGNISTASAIVADVTSKENRSKGMAAIGIAFALGFILGPAIGGLLSKIDLSQHISFLTPFSTPALFAFALGLWNLVMIKTKLPETLSKNKEHSEERGLGILLKIFVPLPDRSVNLINLTYFVFLVSFAGMEFTLTFLASEKLGYTPAQNGMMFVFVGLILTLVQGGYVRRKAHTVGERKMARNGLVILIPGLIMLSMTEVAWQLFTGLFFMAVGSGMIIPCLTSLVSIYSPTHLQGKSLGIFRSLGSLARLIGPLFASILYWRYGSQIPYRVGTGLVLISLFLLMGVRRQESQGN